MTVILAASQDALLMMTSTSGITFIMVVSYVSVSGVTTTVGVEGAMAHIHEAALSPR